MQGQWGVHCFTAEQEVLSSKIQPMFNTENTNIQTKLFQLRLLY